MHSFNKYYTIKEFVVVIIFAMICMLFSGCTSNYNTTLKESTDATEATENTPYSTSKTDVNTTQNVTEPADIKDDGKKNVDFTWEYGFDEWNYSIHIPNEAYNYFKQIDRNKIGNNFSNYVKDPNDDEWIGGIADNFYQEGQKNGYTDYDIICLMVTFVQSLEYVTDKIGTGYDEYPKFPLETLYDESGDCEDSSILLASLIRELGYGVVLVMFEDHMGVGLQGDESFEGTYYEEAGVRYFFIETTSEGWEIGDLPTDLEEREVTLLHLY